MKKTIRFKESHLLLAVYMMASFIFIAILITTAFSKTCDTRFSFDEAYLFNDGWQYESKDGSIQEVSLPNHLAPNMESGLRLKNTLPDRALLSGTTLARNSVFKDFKIYINDELYYDSRCEHTNGGFDKTTGSYWAFVELPEYEANTTITMESTSLYKEYMGNIGSVYLGNRSSIIHALFKRFSYKSILSFLLFALGLFMLIFTGINKSTYKISGKLYYLALFYLWGGIWGYSESGLTQLLISNSNITTVLSFAGYMMMALSFFLYLYSSLNLDNKKKMKWIMFAMYGYVFIATAIQLLGVYDYYETIMIFHTLVMLAVVIYLYIVLVEFFIKKNRAYLYHLFMTVVLAVCFIYEVIKFRFMSKYGLGIAIMVGAMICVIASTIIEMKGAYKIISMGKQAAHYEYLAKYDALTGRLNRTAMDLDIEQHKVGVKQGLSVVAIVCDINNLKYINDTYGHTEGDFAIKKCSDLLYSIFKSYGSCYRTGGDEFVVLAYHCTEDYVIKKIKLFRTRCMEVRKEKPYHLEAALGYSYYEAGCNDSISDAIERADQKMYENKREMKIKTDC